MTKTWYTVRQQLSLGGGAPNPMHAGCLKIRLKSFDEHQKPEDISSFIHTAAGGHSLLLQCCLLSRHSDTDLFHSLYVVISGQVNGSIFTGL